MTIAGNTEAETHQRSCHAHVEKGLSRGDNPSHPDDSAQRSEGRQREGQKERKGGFDPITPGHEIMTEFMSQKDEHHRDRVPRSSCNPGGRYRQNKKKKMDPRFGGNLRGRMSNSSIPMDGHLFLLMTIPVQLLFVFVFPHLLPTLLNNASHDLSSILN